MKTVPSTIVLSSDQPVPDGLDLAMAFAQANQQPLEAFLHKQKTDLQQVKSDLQTLDNKKAFLPGVILAGIAAILLPFSFRNPVFLSINLLGIAGGGIWSQIARKQKQKRILELETEQAKIPQRSVPQVVSHLGKLHYVANIMPFEEGKIVVDATGTKAKQTIVYPEIPDSQNRLQSLSEKLAEIPEELPILLPGVTEQINSEGKPQLTGMEAEMGDVLSMTDRIFVTTVDISTKLPVFSANDDLVHSLRLLSQYLTDGEPAFHLAQLDSSLDRSATALAQTSAEATAARQLGVASGEALMKEAVQRIDNHVAQAKIARDRSLMDILSQGLDSLKGIYDYPLTRFYCPKCHQVEQYCCQTLPVTLAELPDAPVTLLDDLPRSEDIRSLRSLVDSIRRYLLQAEQQDTPLSAEHIDLLHSKVHAYEERIRELAVEVPDLDPRAEVHKHNAVLKYNTTHNCWTCQLCSETFSDEQAQWARMLKVKDDLILPLWDTLWMEKHDERNRIIREKETELRDNIEQEAAFLREEAKVFTEEFRPVRDQLEQAGSGSRVAKQQIEMMLTFYRERGILSADTAREMHNYMNSNATGRSAADIIRLARQLETQLSEEAETVLIRRSQLKDYPDEVRNTAKYFAPASSKLTLLANPVEEE